MSIARDLAIAVAAAALWSASARRPEAAALGVAAGVLAAVCGFLLHEWGHLVASLGCGSVVHFPDRVLAPLLFHFDTRKNDRRQHLLMSAGGYAASALGTAAIVALSSWSTWSGRTAISLSVLGAVATVVLEMPTTVRVLRGGPLPDGYAYRPPRAAAEAVDRG